MVQQSDPEAVSVRLDGRASVEHQIDIHVADLVEAIENTDITVIDILQGLKYVSDYRVARGKMPNLDAELMDRLANGLLHQTNRKKGNLMNQKPTEEAELAFRLVIDFIANVSEFRTAVGKYSAPDLQHRLRIDRRCQPRCSDEQRTMAATLLGLLTLRFPQFKDWRDLVVEGEHHDIEKLMEEFPQQFSKPEIPLADTVYPPPALYFDKNSLALAEMFTSSTETGLSSDQVEAFRKHYGNNVLPQPKKSSLLKMIWTQLIDFMVVILIVVSIVEFALKSYEEGIVLMLVVVINVIIGVYQEHKATKALEALLTLTVPKASVIRDGKQQIMGAEELVPGDLVVLEEGEAVPADLRLCDVAQLDIVESILTGESLPVSKSVRTIRKKTRNLPLGDCKGNAFMTTTVSRGRGRGIVVRTGLKTEIGKISQAISSATTVRTNIERKLTQLGRWLVFISIALVGVIVLIGVAYRRDAKDMVLIGISLAVSVVPEGLVVVVTTSMALGVKRMAGLHAIVKKLPSVETVGSVTVICSDKTGTLTEGKMGAQQIWTSDNFSYQISCSTSPDPNNGEIQRTVSEKITDAMKTNTLSAKHEGIPVKRSIDEMPGNLATSLLVCSMCNNSNLHQADGEWKSIGDPTEVALLVAGMKGGLSRDFFAAQGVSKISEFAFDSDRKMMSSIYCGTEPSQLDQYSAWILAKGAPESITKHCVSYLDVSDSKGFRFLNEFPVKKIDDQFVEYLSQQSAQMASSGLRVLALAIRKVSKSDATAIAASNKAALAETELSFVGLIGLIDPPKAGVKASVSTSKKAGIRVIMITGDHVATATAIAKDLGILDPNNPEECRAMKGYEIDLLSEDQLAEQKPFPVVFARVSPDNKLKIVRALQKKDHSVVMTGDGVNDAPAIKQANVGVAMGIAGTEITKQAADIVLANDDFTTIVVAVKEGRQVYDNILKFVVYLLSCNAAEVFLFLTCAAINLELPFTTIQILWANIFADIPPSLSLGLEPAEKDLMDRKPRPTKQNVLTMSSLLMIAWQSLSMTYLTFGVYYLSVYNGMFGADTPPKQKSLAFILLCTLQLAQSFLSRSILNSSFKVGILGNQWLIIAFAVSYGLMLFGLYVPPVAQWLKLEGIGGIGWAPIIVCLLLHIGIVEIGKYTARILFASEVATTLQPPQKDIPAIIVLESMEKKTLTDISAGKPTYKDFSEPKEVTGDSSATIEK